MWRPWEFQRPGRNPTILHNKKCRAVWHRELQRRDSEAVQDQAQRETQQKKEMLEQLRKSKQEKAEKRHKRQQKMNRGASHVEERKRLTYVVGLPTGAAKAEPKQLQQQAEREARLMNTLRSRWSRGAACPLLRLEVAQLRCTLSHKLTIVADDFWDGDHFEHQAFSQTYTKEQEALSTEERTALDEVCYSLLCTTDAGPLT